MTFPQAQNAQKQNSAATLGNGRAKFSPSQTKSVERSTLFATGKNYSKSKICNVRQIAQNLRQLPSVHVDKNLL